MKLIAIFTTAGSADEARRTARTVVERRLAACAQISEIESFYRWQGAVQNDKEYRVLFKTTDVQYPQVQGAIRELHSYELPAIWSMPLEQTYGPYAEWVAAESSATLSSP
jgi:periplasmic divalent cation tolerance protein